MTPRLAAFAVLAVLAAPATVALAQKELPPEPPTRPKWATEETRRNQPVVYSVPGMDQVTVKKNLWYVGKRSEVRRMDVYMPPAVRAGERRPAVIFIPRGVVPESDPKAWGSLVSWGRLVAASGMVGVTFTDRLGDMRPNLTLGAEDLESAIGYLRAHAGELGIDPERVGLVAFSTGAPLLAVAMGANQRPYVRCLVGLYPLLDAHDSPPQKANGTAEEADRYSPQLRLADKTGGVPPMLVVRAGLDQTPAVNPSIDHFVATAKQAGAPVELIDNPDGRMGFDYLQKDETGRGVVRQTVEFLAAKLEASRVAVVGPAGEPLLPALMAVEEARNAACTKHDREALGATLAAGYHGVDPLGAISDREQELDFYASPDLSIERSEIDQVTVDGYGDTAVLRGRVTWTNAHAKGGDLSGSYRVTRVYVKQDGRWQAVASQATRIPEP